MCITAPCQRLPQHGCSLRTMGAYDGVLCRAIPESSDSSQCHVLYAFVRRVAQGRAGLFVGDALPHVAALAERAGLYRGDVLVTRNLLRSNVGTLAECRRKVPVIPPPSLLVFLSERGRSSSVLA